MLNLRGHQELGRISKFCQIVQICSRHGETVATVSFRKKIGRFLPPSDHQTNGLTNRQKNDGRIDKKTQKDKDARFDKGTLLQ